MLIPSLNACIRNFGPTICVAQLFGRDRWHDGASRQGLTRRDPPATALTTEHCRGIDTKFLYINFSTENFATQGQMSDSSVKMQAQGDSNQHQHSIAQKCSLPGTGSTSGGGDRDDGTCEVLFAFGITLCSVRHRPPTPRPLHVRVLPPDTHKVICHDASAPIKFPFPFLIEWALFRRNRQENAQLQPLLPTHDASSKPFFPWFFSGPKPYLDSSPLKGYAIGW